MTLQEVYDGFILSRRLSWRGRVMSMSGFFRDCEYARHLDLFMQEAVQIQPDKSG